MVRSHSSLGLSTIPLWMWMCVMCVYTDTYIYIYTHSSIEGHLSHFPYGYINKIKGTMNIGTHMSFNISVVSFVLFSLGTQKGNFWFIR